MAAKAKNWLQPASNTNQDHPKQPALATAKTADHVDAAKNPVAARGAET
jgi:hypothetical protein